MMLACGLAKDARAKGALAAVKSAGFSTSPVLSRFLVEAYGEHDEDAALYDFLLNPKGRNFASILAQGGTFTWESWEGGTAASENSESHAYGANAAIEAIQRYVLGVEIVEPQAARVRIRPHFGALTSARGTIPTERGGIRVAWQVQQGTAEVTVHIPANVTAQVSLPKPDWPEVMFEDNALPLRYEGSRIVVDDVGPGEHRFRMHDISSRRTP
jgi:alpha-L-rhamnosidase